ncbi:tRNA (adenosine(37)-N6)-threonylcarbamoyltransferase complex dimerization subunit type 1 TsaB [Legionella fairfieldensis]|uniref:tRNA (adenosine(37)-N6)-threonylcarbamoyltransferase complex dimerization subunit type 1 TsaB n=1 Tax=Legionella fairfieldensis TaxID=45064 RepID=UPI00048FD3A8|nr:tRNA (adenosine(37)-N6)-threonylcarbamoyltransferase complex dimerization subunit type 1 TsaB [Legionella fairfieldensis]
MNLLAIDTSTECASVALASHESLFSKEQEGPRQHAQFILPMIESLLAEAELSMNQLDAIVYGRGPGSFTGLRIACSVAKGLAYAHDLPLFPVSSLAAIAHEVLYTDKTLKNVSVLALIDARMNQLYWACFDRQLNEEVKEQVSDVTDILPEGKQPLVVAGVGYESYLPGLSSAVHSRMINHFTIYPRAQAMLRLVLANKIKPVSAIDASPVYIRNQITQGEPRG